MLRQLFLATLLAANAIAAPPAMEIPAEIRPAGQYVTFLPKGDAVAITYVGLSGLDPMPSLLLKDQRMFALDVRGLAEGKYVFAAIGSKDDEHSRVDFSVVIGNKPDIVKPGEPPVNPPVPQPGTPLAGLRVLILQETSPTVAIPKSQTEALQSRQVIEYLDSKAMEPNGNRRWRKLDPAATTANLPKPWQDLRAAAQPIGDQPWVVVGGLVGDVEKVVFQGPYPQTEAEALTLLKKWGG